METLLRVSLGERIEITIAFAADLWQAMVDVAQIESALLNVALNARDAMPDGGVLTLDAANLHVGGGAFPAGDDLQAGDYVVLSVTDSGGGMAPEVRKRAFEPFFSTKGVGGGSGLGLSMVMGTMQQQGGAVRIDSELGRGTIVHLFLPRAVVIAETPADQASAPACPTGKERILFVEDNEQVRQVVEAMIRSVGYSVTVAKDAEAALALWDDGGQFDLVFTDVVMPGEYTGVDLAGALRARDPHARILLTSGFAYSEEILAKIKELGLEVLSKPYQKVLLADRFRAALDRKAT
jgi:CheY-like chemotaxis protein